MESKNEKRKKSDPFFAEIKDENIEKRVVQRDGHIPKLQKNIEKIQKEKEEKQRKYEEK